jgi:hypothetical protein
VFLFLTLHNDEQSINWDKWFYSPGMPAFKPKFDESLAVICQELADRWTNWKPDTGNNVWPSSFSGCGSGPDPDPAFHVNPDPDLGF